jgi:hypothetical protein
MAENLILCLSGISTGEISELTGLLENCFDVIFMIAIRCNLISPTSHS